MRDDTVRSRRSVSAAVGSPMVRRVRALAMAGSMAGLLPAAWVDPGGVLGVPWGASESRVAAAFPHVRCGPALDPAADALGFRQCSAAVRLGSVRGRANFWLREGRLVALTVRLPAADARRLAEELAERYGPATDVTETATDGGADARPGRPAQWTIGGSLVRLDQRDLRGDGLAVAVPTDPGT